MPDIGFVRKVKGMMEGTGSPAADRFGSMFREEANSFMWRLFQRTTEAYQATMVDVEEEARVSASTASQATLQEMEVRLNTLHVEHNYMTDQLQRGLGEYQLQDREFYQVFGMSLSAWCASADRYDVPLTPVRAVASEALANYLRHGVRPGQHPVSASPRIDSLSADMSMLGHVVDKPPTPGHGLTFQSSRPWGEGGACRDTELAGITPLPPAVSRVTTPRRPEKMRVVKVTLTDSSSGEDEPVPRRSEIPTQEQPRVVPPLDEDALLGSEQGSPSGEVDDHILEDDSQLPEDGEESHHSGDSSRPVSTEPPGMPENEEL